MEQVEPIEGYALKSSGNEEHASDTFTKVGIVGCGILGQEIARMVSSYGIDVIFLELSNSKINDAIKGIKRDLRHMIKRWGMTDSDKRAIMSRIRGTLEYEDLRGCEVVIESIKSKFLSV